MLVIPAIQEAEAGELLEHRVGGGPGEAVEVAMSRDHAIAF